jgi:hypothetical protein
MREKLILLALLALLLLLPGKSVVLAEDPGNPDTCRVGSVDIIQPGQQVVIPVTVYNDEELGGLAIPLVFGRTSYDIVCDSISFEGTRSVGADILGSKIDTTNYRLIFYALYYSSNLPPDDGIVANLFFTTGPNWDTALCVQVDSTFFPPTSRLEFTPRTSGQALYPRLIKGSLGTGFAPVPGLISPADQGYTCSPDTFKFRWSKTSSDLSYIIQYSQDADFTTGVVTAGLTDTSYSVSLTWGTYYWHVKSINLCGDESDYQDTPFSVNVFRIGDASGDGIVDVSDVIYLINYLYKSGPVPVPLESANVSGDEIVDISDAIFLLNYLFKHGSTPSCP